MAMIHKLAIKERKIVALTPRFFVQGGINADQIEIHADAEWLACDSIMVHIDRYGMDPFRALYDGKPMTVPQRFMETPGQIYFALTGYIGDDVKITTARMAPLESGAVIETGATDGGATPEEEQPDLWAQLINLCTETAANEILRQKNEQERQERFEDSITRCEDATKRAEQIAEVQRGTSISLGEGAPVLQGIEGDSYVDTTTGDLWEFEQTEG